MQTQRLNCSLFELKLAPPDSATMEFTGYGAIFNNEDSYGDVIEPGAFNQYLTDLKSGAQQWPAMLLNHGGWGVTATDMMPIGSWLDLEEDGKGLKVKGQLADTQTARDTYALMKMEPRPAITGLSIGYFAREFVMGNKPKDPYRRLTRIDLLEISPVTFPANDKAKISGVKSLENYTEREFEKLLRDSGLSRKEAKIVISQGFRALKTQRDADNNELTGIIAAIKRNNQLLSNNR